MAQGPHRKYPPTTGAKLAERMDLTWDRDDPAAVAALPRVQQAVTAL